MQLVISLNSSCLNWASSLKVLSRAMIASCNFPQTLQKHFMTQLHASIAGTNSTINSGYSMGATMDWNGCVYYNQPQQQQQQRHAFQHNSRSYQQASIQ